MGIPEITYNQLLFLAIHVFILPISRFSQEMAEEPGILTSIGPFSGSMVAPGKMSLLSTIIAKIPSLEISSISKTPHSDCYFLLPV